jgi:Tfp pilus assembly protein FimT
MISEIIIILAILFLLALIAAPLIYYWNKSKSQ